KHETGHRWEALYEREYSPFLIVEHADDLGWYPDTEEEKQFILENVAPIRVKSVADHARDDDPYLAGAFVYHSGSLFYAVFKIRRNVDGGLPFMVDMIGDLPL